MLFVDRAEVPAPASLLDEDGQGKRELGRAEGYYKTRRKKAYEFSAYKGADVVSALETLFRRKCAYCEHLYAVGSPVDVEHFRPKARIKGDEKHRGYWWLACEWTNLLPSCIDCNRSRYHDRVEGAPEFDDGTTLLKALYGKGNDFPITGKRARKPGDNCEAEDPLLIDPTQRDPSCHITWETVNRSHFAAPVWNEAEGAPDKYGLASIRTYGLNRRVLMEERARVVLTIASYEKTLAGRIRRAASSTGDDLENNLAEIIDDLCTLRELAEPDRPYSAAARKAIDQFLSSVRESLQEALRRLPG
nr:hypothetical protein [Luteibacter rhizovicinus]